MELRAVARRCPSRSMTVLGDLAQATAPGAQSSWDDAVVHLGSPPTASIEELELGYRVPAADPRCRQPPAARRWPRACGRPGRCASTGRLPSWCRPPPDDLPAAHRRARCGPWPPPGHRWASSCRSGGATGGRRPRARPGSTFGTGTRGGLDRRRHAPRPTRGEGPRVRRRRGGGAERDPHRRARRPAPLHRPHPGGAGARHRPRRARSRRPWPPDEGRSAPGSTLGRARSPPGRAVTVPNLFLRFVSITAVAGVGLAAVGRGPRARRAGLRRGRALRRGDDRPRSARPAQLRVRRRRVASSPPSRRRSIGSPSRWRRSRSTPSTRCWRWRTPTSTPTTA